VAPFCSQFQNNPASAEEQSLKFLVKSIVNKTAAITAQLAECILLHAYLNSEFTGSYKKKCI